MSEGRSSSLPGRILENDGAGLCDGGAAGADDAVAGIQFAPVEGFIADVFKSFGEYIDRKKDPLDGADDERSQQPLPIVVTHHGNARGKTERSPLRVAELRD
jgi:hypothetical protein